MNTKWIRWFVQLFFVGLVAYLGIQHQVVGGGPEGAAPIDSYCPFGGIETLYSYLVNGTYLPKTNTSNFIILGAVLISVVLFGKGFCVWVCPVGTIQDIMAKVRRFLGLGTIAISPKVHRPLGYFRYLVLVVILVGTVITGEMIFEDYDPFKVMFHFSFETSLAIGILVGFLVLALFVERFWCKYLCPMGAVFSLMNMLKLSRLIKSLKASSVWYPVALTAVIGLTIGSTMLTGVWASKQALPEEHIDASGQVQAPSPEEIKGYMSLEELERLYGIKPEEVLEQLGADPATPPSAKLKDVTHTVDKETEDVRVIVEQFQQK